MPVFRDYSGANRTTENELLGIECGAVLVFLQKARAQSGFNKGLRRMRCDHKPMMCETGLTFA